MAEIIDIRGRLGGRAAEGREREDGGRIYRVRLCGPDLRWVGLVGGVLGRALNLEGFYIDFEDADGLDGFPPAVLCLRAGREVITEKGAGKCPGLVVAAAGKGLDAAALQGADAATVLLVNEAEPEALQRQFGFRGIVVALPVAAITPEPLGVPIACVGGAARLLGVVRWTALEQALREELGVFGAAVHRHLAMALEAFDRTAPWAGRVPAVPEEVG